MYNLERPEREENSEENETEMGTERMHHVHFEEPEDRENFDRAYFSPSTQTLFYRDGKLKCSSTLSQHFYSRKGQNNNCSRTTFRPHTITIAAQSMYIFIVHIGVCKLL